MERSSEPSKQENTKLNFHQPSLSHLSWVAEKLAGSGPALISRYLLLYCVGSIGTIVAAAPAHTRTSWGDTQIHTQPHFSYIILGKIFSPKNILVAANYVTLALFDGRSGRRCIVGNSGQDDDIVHRRKGSMMRCHRQVLGPVSYLVSEGTMKSSFQMVSKGFPPIDKIVGPHFLQPQALSSVNICEAKTSQVV